MGAQGNFEGEQGPFPQPQKTLNLITVQNDTLLEQL